MEGLTPLLSVRVSQSPTAILLTYHPVVSSVDLVVVENMDAGGLALRALPDLQLLKRARLIRPDAVIFPSKVCSMLPGLLEKRHTPSSHCLPWFVPGHV